MVALSLEKIKRGGAGMNFVSKGRNEGIKSVMKDFVERAVNLYENMRDQPVCERGCIGTFEGTAGASGGTSYRRSI